MLYYYRYLNLFQIREWVGTLRDTTRNLRLFDFVHRYAIREEDQNYLEQWRPYILRLHATAAAMIQVEGGTHDVALEVLNKTIQQIEALEEREDQTFQFERKRSLLTLQELIRQIEKKRPVPPLERLERELRHAVELQNFEQAAQLRDQIRDLRNKSAESPNPGK
jgi:xanthine/CO dehydrogenase XdhC/CoxF family maturation factor